MSDNPAIKLRNKIIQESPKNGRFWDMPLKKETSESLKEMNMARLVYSMDQRFDEVYDALKDMLDIMEEFKKDLDRVKNDHDGGCSLSGKAPGCGPG